MSSKEQKLQKIYSKIDHKIGQLKEQTCLNCVDGCGDCCKRFEPYISVLEAISIARYLRENPDKYELFCKRKRENEKNWSACPFYAPDQNWHCTIYSIRPLICRLFGFSVNRSAQGEEFATCKNIRKEFPDRVKKAEELTNQELNPPVYQDIAKEVQDIDFELATDYHPFSRSVEIAYNNYEDILSRKYAPKKTEKEGEMAVPFSQVLREKFIAKNSFSV